MSEKTKTKVHSPIKDEFIFDTPEEFNADYAALHADTVARHYKRIDDNIGAEQLRVRNMGRFGKWLIGHSSGAALKHARAKADTEVRQYLPQIQEAAIQEDARREAVASGSLALYGKAVYPVPVEVTGRFRIDKSLPTTEALDRLVYIETQDLVSGNYNRSESVTLAKQLVPIDRIVAGRPDMKSWAAKGEYKLLGNYSVPSIEYASSIADEAGYTEAEEGIKLRPFIDSAGEIWFQTIDGTHRTIAAKLNNEAVLEADIVMPKDPRNLDYYGHDLMVQVSA